MSWPSMDRKCRPVTRLPTSRPCMSHMHTSTVSTWPLRIRAGRRLATLPAPSGLFSQGLDDGAPSSNPAADGADAAVGRNEGASPATACERPPPGAELIPLADGLVWLMDARAF